MKLPYVKQPCKDCPFRKDSTKGWLGETRMTEILASDAFTCHKTGGKSERLQCAGHMIIKNDNSVFVRTAKQYGIALNLKGHDLVFNTEQDCIDHHA